MNHTYSTLIKGAIAGFGATIPMTGAMVLMHQLLPQQEQYPLPPYQITENLSEKSGLRDNLDDKELTTATKVSHFGYGAAAGAVYAATTKSLSLSPLVKGTAFGLAVWTGSYLGWLPALGILSPATEHPAGRNALMIAAHLVWGSAVGILAERLENKMSSGPVLPPSWF